MSLQKQIIKTKETKCIKIILVTSKSSCINVLKKKKPNENGRRDEEMETVVFNVRLVRWGFVRRRKCILRVKSETTSLAKREGKTWAEFRTQTLSKYCYRPLLHANVEIYPLPDHLECAQTRLPPLIEISIFRIASFLTQGKDFFLFFFSFKAYRNGHLGVNTIVLSRC